MIHVGTEKHLLCDYLQKKTWEVVQRSDIVAAVRGAAKYLKLHEQRIHPDLIGLNSLRAGGDMVIKITGYNDYTIRKIGRWKYDIWQMYIHIQIPKLYKGVAENISTSVSYHNTASIDPTMPAIEIS